MNIYPRIASSVPNGSAINEGPASEVLIVFKLPFELQNSHCSTRQLRDNSPSVRSPQVGSNSRPSEE